jgi:hypothetical protein
MVYVHTAYMHKASTWHTRIQRKKNVCIKFKENKKFGSPMLGGPVGGEIVNAHLVTK